MNLLLGIALVSLHVFNRKRKASDTNYHSAAPAQGKPISPSIMLQPPPQTTPPDLEYVMHIDYFVQWIYPHRLQLLQTYPKIRQEIIPQTKDGLSDSQL